MWPTSFNNMNSNTFMNRMGGLMKNFGSLGSSMMNMMTSIFPGNQTSTAQASTGSIFPQYVTPATMYGYPNAEGVMTPDHTLYNIVSDNFNLIAKYQNIQYSSIYAATNPYYNMAMNNSYYYGGVPGTNQPLAQGLIGPYGTAQPTTVAQYSYGMYPAAQQTMPTQYNYDTYPAAQQTGTSLPYNPALLTGAQRTPMPNPYAPPSATTYNAATAANQYVLPVSMNYTQGVTANPYMTSSTMNYTPALAANSYNTSIFNNYNGAVPHPGYPTPYADPYNVNTAYGLTPIGTPYGNYTPPIGYLNTVGEILGFKYGSPYGNLLNDVTGDYYEFAQGVTNPAATDANVLLGLDEGDGVVSIDNLIGKYSTYLYGTGTEDA